MEMSGESGVAALLLPKELDMFYRYDDVVFGILS